MIIIGSIHDIINNLGKSTRSSRSEFVFSYSIIIIILHPFQLLYTRIVSAVYDMIGKEGDIDKAQELFSKMDQNSDGLVSQDEFVTIMKQDKSLLGLLQGKA